MRPTRNNQSNDNHELSEMFIGGDGKLSIKFDTLELEIVGGVTNIGQEAFECIRK